MSVLERGTYTLANVHFKSFVTLISDTDDAPAVAETLPVGEDTNSEIGHKWAVVENQNGTYGFRNSTYDSLWAWHPENQEVQATRHESQARAAWRIVRLPGAHGFLIKTLREDLCWHLNFPDPRTPIVLVPPAQANRSLWIFRNTSTGQTFPSFESDKEVPQRVIKPTPSPFSDIDDTVIFDFQSNTPATYKLDVVLLQALNEHSVVVGRTANSTRATMKRISDGLLRLADSGSLHIDVRVGAVSYADKCSTVWPLAAPRQLDYDSSSEELPQNVRDNHLHFDDGTDSFSAALRRALGLDWRKGAAKTVMFMPMANVTVDEPDANSEKDDLIRRMEEQNLLLSVIANATSRDRYLESTPLLAALKARKSAQTATLSNDAILGWMMASATSQNDLSVLTDMFGPRAHAGPPHSSTSGTTGVGFPDASDSEAQNHEGPSKPLIQNDTPPPDIVSVQPRMPPLTPPILVFPSPEKTEQRSLSPDSSSTFDFRHAEDRVLTVFDFMSTRAATNQLDIVIVHIQESAVDFQQLSQQILAPIEESLSIVNMRVGHIIVRKVKDQSTFTRISLGIPSWWQSNEQRCRTFIPSGNIFHSAIDEALKMDWRGEAAKTIIFMPMLGPVQHTSSRAIAQTDKDIVFQLRKRGMLLILDADQMIRDQYLRSTSLFRTLRDRFSAVSLRRSRMPQWIAASSFGEQEISSLVSVFPLHAKLWEAHFDDSEDDGLGLVPEPQTSIPWNPWDSHSDSMSRSSNTLSSTELEGKSREGSSAFEEAAHAIHGAFMKCSDPTMHYALCGPYSVALMGFSPPELKTLDFVVSTTAFRRVRDLLADSSWCNWRFENAHLIVHFRSRKGLVKVRCIDAERLALGLLFVVGVSGSIMQAHKGLFVLRITHVIRVMTITSFRLNWQESVADILRLVGRLGLPLDHAELTTGLTVSEMEYLHLYIRGLDKPFYTEPTSITFPTPVLAPRSRSRTPRRHSPSGGRGSPRVPSPYKASSPLYMPRPFQ